MVRQTYKFHDIVIPQADDPTKTISKTVYQSQTHHSEAGMIGFDGADKTLVSDSLPVTDSFTVVRGEGASADNFDFVEDADVQDKDLFYFLSGAETITVRHDQTPGAGELPIVLIAGANKVLSTTVPMVCFRIGTKLYETAPTNSAFLDQANVFTVDQEIERTGAAAILILDRPEIIADNVNNGEIHMNGLDDASNPHTYLKLISKMVSDVSGAEESAFLVSVTKGGSLLSAIQVNAQASNRFDVVDLDFSIDSGKKLYVDGGIDTYIIESSANVMKFFTGGAEAVAINSAGLGIAKLGWGVSATQKLFLDGGIDSYFSEPSANLIRLTIGASTNIDFATTFTNFFTDILVQSTDKVRLDGNAVGNTYIHEVSADIMENFVGGARCSRYENASILCGSALTTTTRVNSFLYIPTTAGVPTGVPTAKTGLVALTFDTTNNDLYVYDGSWIKIALA